MRTGWDIVRNNNNIITKKNVQLAFEYPQQQTCHCNSDALEVILGSSHVDCLSIFLIQDPLLMYGIEHMSLIHVEDEFGIM